MVDYSKFSNIDASDDEEPAPAPSPKPPRSKRARRRAQLADLASDLEIQTRFAQGRPPGAEPFEISRIDAASNSADRPWREELEF